MKELKRPTNVQLQALLHKHGLTRQATADLVHVQIHTVNAWCATENAGKHRPMPLGSWELLLIKVGEIKY